MESNKYPHFKSIDLGKYSSMTLDDYDREMFEKTQWSGMKFEREESWKEYSNREFREYASPVFKMENGDRVVVNRMGELITL